MDAACADLLNAWCNHNCPLSADHGQLFARHDRASAGSDLKWRCYATITLSNDKSKYVRGSEYCTRDAPLARLMQHCSTGILGKPSETPLPSSSSLVPDDRQQQLKSVPKTPPKKSPLIGIWGPKQAQRRLDTSAPPHYEHDASLQPA